MRLTVFITICITLCMTTLSFGAATVFFKDGTKETGDSAWIEGSQVYLSRSGSLYEYTTDEVLLEETEKSSRIGKYADSTMPDSRGRHAAGRVSNDLLDQLFTEADFDRQIDRFIQQFETGFTSAAAGNAELSGIFSQALAGFDPDRAKRKIRTYYRSHLDNGTLERILAWSRSPLGLKVNEAQMRMEFRSPEAAQQLINDLENNPPPPRRRALILELDRVGMGTEMAKRLMVDASSGVANAIPADTADKREARKQALRQMKQKWAELMPILHAQVQMALTHAFRDFSDAELREYIRFLRREPAMKFNRVTMGALGEMTRDMSASVIRQVVNAAEGRRAAGGS